MTEDFLVFKEICLANGTCYSHVQLDNGTYAPAGFIAVRKGKELVLLNVRHIAECVIDEEQEKNLGKFDWYPEVIQTS